MATKEGKGRGFASLSKTRLKEVSAKGGKGTAPENRRFYIDREAASEAGHKSKKGQKNDNRTSKSRPKENA